VGGSSLLLSVASNYTDVPKYKTHNCS